MRGPPPNPVFDRTLLISALMNPPTHPISHPVPPTSPGRAVVNGVVRQLKAASINAVQVSIGTS